MASQKLVRCEVVRPDATTASVRFVPLPIFGLWQHLMESRHGFRIQHAVSSLWVEMSESDAQDVERDRVERVVEMRLFTVSERDGMINEVCRYVPDGEIDEVRGVLLSHYRAGGVQEHRVRERAGVWFRPRPESRSPSGIEGLAASS